VPKRPRDVNELAKQLVDEATGEAEPQREPPAKDAAAVGRGKARAEKLSPERRSQIAKKAADARWERRGGEAQS
jgi:hypothetical protein